MATRGLLTPTSAPLTQTLRGGYELGTWGPSTAGDMASAGETLPPERRLMGLALIALAAVSRDGKESRISRRRNTGSWPPRPSFCTFSDVIIPKMHKIFPVLLTEPQPHPRMSREHVHSTLILGQWALEQFTNEAKRNGKTRCTLLVTTALNREEADFKLWVSQWSPCDMVPYS